MPRKLAEWASGHGRATKIRLSDGCGGKTISMAVPFWYNRLGTIAINLKVIREMSAKKNQGLLGRCISARGWGFHDECFCPRISI